jgi:hypothetical protein
MKRPPKDTVRPRVETPPPAGIRRDIHERFVRLIERADQRYVERLQQIGSYRRRRWNGTLDEE